MRRPVENHAQQTIAGRYLLREPLGGGVTAAVYRGEDLVEKREVAVKLLLPPSGDEAAEGFYRFRREGRVLAGLSHPGIVRCHGFGELPEGGAYIVMERAPGRPLAEWIAKGPLAIETVRALASDLAAALAHAHKAGVIHRDIKPQNVVVSDDGGGPRAMLVDFGLAHLLDAQDEPRDVAGTYGYMAPEQAGFFARPLDARSDLYSLGVVIYEMLTGRRPFEAKTLAELFHMHAAKRPVPPRALRPEVPAALEAIVLKLLEKDPDDRYQSADGLLEDLGNLDALAAAIGELGPTALDAAGRPLRALRREVPLTGRETEQAAIRRAADLAARGEGRVLLIEGPKGSGKSRLLEEVREATLLRGGVFLYGRSAAGAGAGFFEPIAGAIRGRLATLRRSEPAEHARVSAALERIASEVQDPLLFSFFEPEVRARLEAASAKPEPEPDPERRRHRLRVAVLRILLSLGGQGHGPVTLAIDDLDQSDEEMAALLSRIARLEGHLPLLVVAALEIETSCGERGAARLFREDPPPSRLELVRLVPLAAERARELVVARLRPLGEPNEAVLQLIVDRAGGNPGNIEAICRRIAERGSLEGSAIAALFEAENATHTPPLSSRIREEVARLACLRRAFGFKTAIAALGVPSDRGIEILDAAIEAGLIKRDALAPPYRFASERARAELLASLAPEVRRAVHTRIAERLEALPPEDPEHAPFEIAHHFEEAALGPRAIPHLVRAGDFARSIFAYEGAVTAYRRALELMDGRAPAAESTGGEIGAAVRGLGEALIALGRYGEAIATLERALEGAGTTLERCRVSISMGAAAFRAGDGARAERYLAEALRALDVRIARSQAGRALSLGRAIARQLLHTLFPRWFTGGGGEASPEDLERFRLFRELERIYYFIDPVTTADMHLRGLNLAERYRPTRAFGFLSSSHAVLCGLLGFFGRARRYGERALATARALGDEALAAEAHLYLGMAVYWEGNFEEAIGFFDRCEGLLAHRFDPWTTHAAWYFRILALFQLGRFREALATSEALTSSAREVDDERGIASGLLGSGLAIASLRGGGEALPKIEEACARFRRLNDNVLLMQSLRALGWIQARRGNLRAAVSALEESRAMIESKRLIGADIVDTYSLLAEVLLDSALLAKLPRGERRARTARARGLIRRALRLSRTYPGTRALALSAAARLDFVRGARAAALARLREANRIAHERGQRPLLGRSWADMAALFAETDPARAAECAAEAREVFNAIEARPDLAMLARRFESPEWAAERPPRSSSSEGALLAEKRKLEALFEVGKTLHAARDIDELLGRIVEVAIEVTGAERGFLFLTAAETPSAETLRPIVVRTANPAAAPAEPSTSLEGLGVSRTLLREIEARGEPLILYDAAADEALRGARSIVASGLRSILCVPLRARGGAIGLLYLDSRLVRGLFGARDMELLSAFAAQAALAIENARNLRDLAEANRTLRETQAQLVQSAKMSAIGQLAAGISHEVRNPLHVIGGSIYYLRELLRGTQNPKVEECLSHIEGEVGRAVGLIDNLLALARPQDAPFEELSLNDVVARSLGLVRAMAEKRGVAIEVDLADRLPPVLGNAGQLQQVALNVLLNGIQALEGRGGKIRVRTTAEEAVVRAEFEDDGPGIAPEVMEKIFEPFFSGREGGTGLGLYVCYGIARRHGGRIECRSEPGRGATFTVTLPAIKEAERSAVAPARA